MSENALRISGEKNLVAFIYFEGREGTSAFALHSEDRRPNSQAQNYNHYWAAVDNVYSRNILDGFPVLAAGANQRFDTFTRPNGNKIEGNILLGMSATVEDAYGNQTEAEFKEANSLTGNHILSASGDAWESSTLIEDSPYTPINISEVQPLLWEGNEIGAPTWWSSIRFEK